MLVTVDDLVKQVRIILDMNDQSSSLITIGDAETLQLNEIIQTKLTDAARYIEMAAPTQLIDNTIALTGTVDTVATTGECMGYMYLPSQFMRLIAFQMKSWARPAIVIDDSNPAYLQMHSQWAGLRGNPEAPVVALVNYADGEALEIFTTNATEAGSTDGIKRSNYVPLPTVETLGTESTTGKIIYGKIEVPKGDCKTGDKALWISSRLQDAIAYYAAYLTCLTYGNANLAGAMAKTAYDLAEIPMAVPQPNAAEEQQQEQE